VTEDRGPKAAARATVTTHRAGVVWHGDRDDLRAHTVTAGGQIVSGSCSPEWGGDPAKADPEALFVAALSACHMLWFLDLARRDRLRVEGYEDDAQGTMDGTRFMGVTLHPRVSFQGEVAAETVADLHARSHARCFIANSVSCPVEVATP